LVTIKIFEGDEAFIQVFMKILFSCSKLFKSYNATCGFIGITGIAILYETKFIKKAKENISATKYPLVVVIMGILFSLFLSDIPSVLAIKQVL
jgi:type II secretory pathway component PulF